MSEMTDSKSGVRKIISKYKLPLFAELKAVKMWKDASEREGYVDVPRAKIGITVLIAVTAMALWMRSIFPDLLFFEGMRNLAIYMVWFLGLSTVYAVVSGIGVFLQDKDKVFQKWALDTCHESSGWLKCFGGISVVFFITGLIMNGLYVSSVSAVGFVAANVFLCAKFREKAEKILISTPPPENTEEVDAELGV